MRRAIVTTDFVRQFSSVIGSSQVDALLGSFPSAIQASESAGWANDPESADTFSSRLGDEVTALTRSIQIVRPSRGSYSLASSSAPLLVTVLNTLPVAVTIRVALSSARGVAGFRADQVVQTIPANSRRTIKVQAHVSRSGRFRIDAQLSSPAGGALGEPLELTIYSSALGTIGVVITIIALAVLVLALINRFVRRWRHHRALVRMMTRAAPVPAGVHG
jgi:small-conductance mechanosensitive channel